jgi:hypothetical protein
MRAYSGKYNTAGMSGSMPVLEVSIYLSGNVAQDVNAIVRYPTQHHL